MKLTRYKLGDLIVQRREKNEGFDVPIRGVSREGFIKPKQQDADTSIYNVFYRNDFVFNPARMELNSIALNLEFDKALCSSLYEVFYVKDQSIVLPEFLNLHIKRDEFARHCEYIGSGSAREYCRVAQISEFDIDLPSIEVQQKIVDANRLLAKRIDTNKKLIATLEQTAQTLYRHTFVDNIDLGNLPEGWRMGTIGEEVNCFDYKRKPLSEEERREIKGEYPYYGAISVVDYINSFIFDGDFILFSEDGANIIDEFGHPALQYVWGKFWVNNHAHVLQGNDIVSTEYLYIALKNADVHELVTGAAQPKINQQNMNGIQIIVPDRQTMTCFSNNVKSLFDVYKLKVSENQALTQMQTLLPSKMGC